MTSFKDLVRALQTRLFIAGEEDNGGSVRLLAAAAKRRMAVLMCSPLLLYVAISTIGIPRSEGPEGS